MDSLSKGKPQKTRGVQQTQIPQMKIYVCSPWRLNSLTPDDLERERRENEERVRLACRLIVKLGYMPLCPHNYFTRFLDDTDPGERSQGMAFGMEWLKESDELWVFGEQVSDGMAAEISLARDLGIPVRCMPEPLPGWEKHKDFFSAYRDSFLLDMDKLAGKIHEDTGLPLNAVKAVLYAESRILDELGVMKMADCGNRCEGEGGYRWKEKMMRR
ncbi:MAG: hypothetical protein LUH14_06170 [Clostridiaceae bacterium]|nr:hypothetical protein [Clostridiaceae bacterium]